MVKMVNNHFNHFGHQWLRSRGCIGLWRIAGASPWRSRFSSSIRMIVLWSLVVVVLLGRMPHRATTWWRLQSRMSVGVQIQRFQTRMPRKLSEIGYCGSILANDRITILGILYVLLQIVENVCTIGNEWSRWSHIIQNGKNCWIVDNGYQFQNG